MGILHSDGVWIMALGALGLATARAHERSHVYYIAYDDRTTRWYNRPSINTTHYVPSCIDNVCVVSAVSSDCDGSSDWR
jgi:hypothetical protein